MYLVATGVIVVIGGGVGSGTFFIVRAMEASSS